MAKSKSTRKKKNRKKINHAYRAQRGFVINIIDDTPEGVEAILAQPPLPVPAELARTGSGIATMPYTPGMEIPIPGRTKSTYDKERDRCDGCKACPAWKDSTGCAQHGWGLFWDYDGWDESYITLCCLGPDGVEQFLRWDYDIHRNRCAQCDTCPLWQQDTGCPRYGFDIVNAVTGLPPMSDDPKKCMLDLNNPDIREEFGLEPLAESGSHDILITGRNEGAEDGQKEEDNGDLRVGSAGAGPDLSGDHCRPA